MRIHRYATVYLAIIFEFAFHCITYGQDSQRASYVPPWQLKGLKSVDLVVFVAPWDIPKSAEITKKIEKVAEKLLQEAGLSIEGGQGAVLSIEVDSYQVEEKALRKRLIIQVKTELSEEATFKRDPTLDNPHGFTTWDIDWADLVHLKNLESHILKGVEFQVQEFCSHWQFVNDRTSKIPY